MTKRYFLSSPLGAALPTSVRLEDQEAHHLISVMRGKVGDEVILFDGTGLEYVSTIERIEKRAVVFSVATVREVSRESSRRLHLGVALPKGDRQQWLCEKLVELGCDQLTPLITRRGVAEPVDAALARLRRFVIEASKQCGRNTLMQIGSPMGVKDFVETRHSALQSWFLDSSGELIPHASNPSNGSLIAAVGPEGGWSEEEIVVAIEGGWRIVSLGSRILRVETAAAAIAARICLD